MLVNIRTSTAFCGEDFDEVYEFPQGSSEQYINKYANELAWDRAYDFGCEEQAEEEGVDPEVFYSIEILTESEDKIIEEYSEILQA